MFFVFNRILTVLLLPHSRYGPVLVNDIFKWKIMPDKHDMLVTGTPQVVYYSFFEFNFPLEVILWPQHFQQRTPHFKTCKRSPLAFIVKVCSSKVTVYDALFN